MNKYIMKRVSLILSSILIASLIGIANGQTVVNETKKEVRVEKKVERKALRKLEGTVTSEFVKKAFYTDFGNITNVVFARRDFMDEATFTKEGDKITAYYDYHGVLVGTTSVVPFDKIPLPGQLEIKKKYPDYKVESVIFYDDNEANDTDMVLYGIQFDDADNYFVELSGKDKNLVLQVNPFGEIFFFKELR
jgi:hypothetical protein